MEALGHVYETQPGATWSILADPDFIRSADRLLSHLSIVARDVADLQGGYRILILLGNKSLQDYLFPFCSRSRSSELTNHTVVYSHYSNQIAAGILPSVLCDLRGVLASYAEQHVQHFEATYPDCEVRRAAVQEARNYRELFESIKPSPQHFTSGDYLWENLKWIDNVGSASVARYCPGLGQLCAKLDGLFKSTRKALNIEEAMGESGVTGGSTYWNAASEIVKSMSSSGESFAYLTRMELLRLAFLPQLESPGQRLVVLAGDLNFRTAINRIPDLRPYLRSPVSCAYLTSASVIGISAEQLIKACADLGALRANNDNRIQDIRDYCTDFHDLVEDVRSAVLGDSATRMNQSELGIDLATHGAPSARIYSLLDQLRDQDQDNAETYISTTSEDEGFVRASIFRDRDHYKKSKILDVTLSPAEVRSGLSRSGNNNEYYRIEIRWETGITASQFIYIAAKFRNNHFSSPYPNTAFDVELFSGAVSPIVPPSPMIDVALTLDAIKIAKRAHIFDEVSRLVCVFFNTGTSLTYIDHSSDERGIPRKHISFVATTGFRGIEHVIRDSHRLRLNQTNAKEVLSAMCTALNLDSTA